MNTLYLLFALITGAGVAVLTRQPPPVTSGIPRAPLWIWGGGLFGGTVIRLSTSRVVGVVLLLLGVSLIRWK